MDWQTPVAVLIVVVAASWLIRRMWRVVAKAWTGDASVSSCSQCTRNPEANPPTPLVQLKNTQKRT